MIPDFHLCHIFLLHLYMPYILYYMLPDQNILLLLVPIPFHILIVHNTSFWKKVLEVKVLEVKDLEVKVLEVKVLEVKDLEVKDLAYNVNKMVVQVR